jgi:hypothetical protein
MLFLQPIVLAALPLIALPIVIHLINQRRYQSIRWGAMMFLLTANRMSRGYARLRQWLILAFRMLAIAGLLFAVSRPLASGWFGKAAGDRADTTIILLDRSPSMRQQGTGTTVSKLEAGRHRLAQALRTLGSGRWVLIDSATNRPTEIESPDELLRLVSAEPVSTSADFPAMLESARDYLRDNQAGRTEIWICSDLRQNDWTQESGRWQTLRDSFLELPQGLRFHLLAFPEPAPGNVSVRVTGVRRQETSEGAEILVSLKLSREGGGDTNRDVQVQLDIGGTRSEVTVQLTGPMTELKEHRIPIERSQERGWGKVSIPADANPADNDFYFTFDRPQPRRTVVVTESPRSIAALQLAASISPDPRTVSSVEVISPTKVATVDWDSVALLVWHGPLPEEAVATAVKDFLDRGGQVVFLPPPVPGAGSFAGAQWGNWVDDPKSLTVENWRGDQDVLAHTESGAGLPVGQLQVNRFCELVGELTPLATLKGGRPLLARLPTNRGGAYFCTTTSDAADSSMAANGVVLFVFVQRVLAVGSSALGRTRQLIAGEAGDQAKTWHQVAGPPDALSTEYAHHAGVYSSGDRLLAVNRAAAEDQAAVLAGDAVADLFRGLDFTRIDDQAGGSVSLIQEVWRPFLVAMLIALLVEAARCMPRGAVKEKTSGFGTMTSDQRTTATTSDGGRAA